MIHTQSWPALTRTRIWYMSQYQIGAVMSSPSSPAINLAFERMLLGSFAKSPNMTGVFGRNFLNWLVWLRGPIAVARILLPLLKRALFS